MGYPPLLNYLQHKHGMCEGKLDCVNLLALQDHLSKLKYRTRALIIKLIHDGIPTYATMSRQGKEKCPLCPRCKSSIEISSHVFSCPHLDAQAAQQEGLNTFLTTLPNIGNPSYLLATFEYKISLTLDISFIQNYCCQSLLPPTLKHNLLQAIRHQNVLRWDMFLKGFSSIYWVELYNDHDEPSEKHKSRTWGEQLVAASLSCLKHIWDDRNQFLHGKTRLESKHKLRERVHSAVQKIYASPPKLHRQYPSIRAMSLEQRLRHNTTHLQ